MYKFYSKVTALLITVLYLAGCRQQQAQIEDSLNQTSKTSTCSIFGDIVRSVKTIPFYKGKGTDQAYLRVMRADESEVDCLIDLITDTTPMKDPRESMPVTYTTVGDIALFLITDKENLAFEAILPPALLDEWENMGIYAYFGYVNEVEGGRSIIQSRVRHLVSEN